MAESTPGAEAATADGVGSLEYDAFLSYAHRDRQVTTAIQKGLHQIGRRLGQLRALRVFRDDTNLTASPDLWGKITEALDRSRYMIVVLSPQSAASHWVNEEISYWLRHRENAHLMLVLAEGQLLWDATTQRFDPARSDATPLALTEPGSLPVEPLYIDVSADAPWNIRSLVFRDKLTSLAAPIHGKPKDQLTGDDLREQTRFRRLRAAAVAGLVVLTVVAVVAAGVAIRQREVAEQRLRDAVVAKLNSEGAAMLAGLTPGGDVRAIQELLAANAIHANPMPILDAQIARFTTQKIVDTGSRPGRLAYSPNGKRIATAQADGTVRQWDAGTGAPSGPVLTGQDTAVHAVAYTQNGTTVAAVGADGVMRLWNAGTGASLTPRPDHVDGSLTAIAVSPDGELMATGGDDEGIQQWNPHSGALIKSVRASDRNNEFISDVTFDRGGALFAVSGVDGNVGVFDTNPYKLHTPLFQVHRYDGVSDGPAWKLAFSPDSHTIAVGSDDLQLWNADTGSLSKEIRVGASRSLAVMSVAFSPDGHRIATGRSDGAVQLWNTDTGEQIGDTMTGHTAAVVGLAFSPNGNQIATTSVDGTLRLWSAVVGQVMRGPDHFVGEVAFSPDGHRLAASGDNAVQQWDLATGQTLPPLMLDGDGGKFFGFVDDGRIVTAAGDAIQMLNADTSQALQPAMHIDIPQGRRQFAFSRDGRTVAVGDAVEGTVQLWSVASGQRVRNVMRLDGPDLHMMGMAFSPDGRRLVVGNYEGGLRAWSVDAPGSNGDAITPPATGNSVISVAFSRDGGTVAAGHVDGTVALWDPVARQQLSPSPMRGHTGQVVTLAYGLPHQLASGGGDATLRLWDTSAGTPAASPLTRPDTITSVAISPNGRLVASATLDGSVQLAPGLSDTGELCKKLAFNMSQKQWRTYVSPGIPYIPVCTKLPPAPD